MCGRGAGHRLAFVLGWFLAKSAITGAYLFQPTICFTRRSSPMILKKTLCDSLTPSYRVSLLQSTSDEDVDGLSDRTAMAEVQKLKMGIIKCCEREKNPSNEEVGKRVRELESLAETLGIGQASSHSGLLSGEWELLHSPEDVTRSSPFFWAFRKAFPNESDQIFSITDAIPAPVKEVGPATQVIELDSTSSSSTECGKLVSRVKVATLGGLATSMMTTRATIMGVEGLEGIRIRIDTTKPEESTILEKLGVLGEAINTNAPPFPSGEALERIRQGSSEVVMVTSFCDETLRISRNEDAINDPYVWRRLSFRGSTEI